MQNISKDEKLYAYIVVVVPYITYKIRKMGKTRRRKYLPRWHWHEMAWHGTMAVMDGTHKYIYELSVRYEVCGGSWRCMYKIWLRNLPLRKNSCIGHPHMGIIDIHIWVIITYINFILFMRWMWVEMSFEQTKSYQNFLHTYT